MASRKNSNRSSSSTHAIIAAHNKASRQVEVSSFGWCRARLVCPFSLPYPFSEPWRAEGRDGDDVFYLHEAEKVSSFFFIYSYLYVVLFFSCFLFFGHGGGTRS